MNKIPLSIPNLMGNEQKYLQECLDTNFVSTAGPFVGRFEEEFAKYIGCKRAVAVNNGTSALHLSLIISNIGVGDEVIVPNLTFVAPVNAVKYTGADPVFIDSHWKDLGMSPEVLESWLANNTKMGDQDLSINTNTGKTIKAIIPVHIFGHVCDVEKIKTIADKYNLIVIEDASESLGAQLNGKHSGTFGKLGCFSFNGNKIMTSGGGGMVVTDNDDVADKLKHLSTTAKTDGLNFFHDQVGYNYRMVNILAALGVAQLEMISKFLKIKKENFNFYQQNIINSKLFSMYLPENQSSTNHWFYALVLNQEEKDNKDKIIQRFLDSGIDVRPIWTPMKNLPMYKDCQATVLETSNDIFDRIINIPCSTSLTKDQMASVCEVINKIN